MGHPVSVGLEAATGVEVERHLAETNTAAHFLAMMVHARVRVICWRMGHAASAAKRDLRVGASGRPSSHAARRSRFSATAVATVCKWLFASPR